ncbi:MAG: ATP-binding protein [Alphaproteobacteria bacterium]|nr:ATP-binding protein [Alphaproteobacteria bacterium]
MIPHLAYNPGLLDRDAVVAGFVARGRELERVLEDIRSLRVGHHVLVAGARGMGKTTLLRRVEAEVARDPALRSWLALKFPEEQYNVRTVADFWVNCLDAMADAFEAAGSVEQARALDADVAALPDDDVARGEDALALLQRYADGRHLLLLVDNLDLLAERVDGWELRRVLSDPERDLTIVGATSGDALFTADYGKPFLDFFAVVPLDPLTFTEARDLLHELATRDGAAGLLELLERDDGRFYGLFTLSGGNPRTLIQLYSVLSRPDAKERDIEGDLEQLLDQVTPLYKSRFEQLPTQSQQVMDAVAVHWAPVMASTVAEAMRMEVTQVSAQLSRLQRLGWVQKVELPDTARSGFQVAERFFNVWYLVRTSRRMRRKLMLLAECLVVLHGKDAVADRARQALADPSSLGAAVGLLAEEFDDTPWSRAIEHKLRLKDLFAGSASLLMVAGERWERAAELAAAIRPNDEVSAEDASQVFDLVLGRGQADQLSTFLERTPFADRMMPYAAAARALATGDERQLLSWPVEVRQAALDIVRRFAAPPPPPAAARPKKGRGRRGRAG